MVLVEVERKLARKAGNNARSTVRLGCILSPPLYMQTHCLPDRKSRDKLREKWVRLPPGTGSVFTYKDTSVANSAT